MYHWVIWKNKNKKDVEGQCFGENANSAVLFFRVFSHNPDLEFIRIVGKTSVENQ